MGIHLKFTIKDARKLLLVLILFEIFLILAPDLGPLLNLPTALNIRFDLNGEATIPSWFSSMQLFAIGVLFLFSRNWSQADRIVGPYFLLLVGIGFIFLSMDEAVAIHEEINNAFRHLEWLPLFNGRKGLWIPIYSSIAILLTVIGARTIKSVFKIYPRQAAIMVWGVMVGLFGGIGLEIIYYQFIQGTDHTLLFKIETALEELFEMIGASLILYGAILCAYFDDSKQ